MNCVLQAGLVVITGALEGHSSVEPPIIEVTTSPVEKGGHVHDESSDAVPSCFAVVRMGRKFKLVRRRKAVQKRLARGFRNALKRLAAVMRSTGMDSISIEIPVDVCILLDPLYDTRKLRQRFDRPE